MPIYTDKRTGKLFVQFDYNRQTFKQYLPAGATKKDAQKLETKMRSDAFMQANGLMPRTEILFEDFVQEYYLPHVKNNNSPEDFDKAEHICIAAKPFLKGKSLRSIRPDDIERFKSYRALLPTQHKRERKPATIVREMSYISKLFSLAVKNDFCDYNPVSRVDMPKFDNTQNTILSVEDADRFFASFDTGQGQWAKEVCLVALFTGLRQKDVLSLTVFDIDLVNRNIRRVQGKTKRIVEVPMNNLVFEIVSRRTAKGGLLFPSPKTGKQARSCRKAIAGAVKRAEIPRITIRDLRRTYGTRLHEMGYDDSTVAQLLGHGDLRSIHRYKRGQTIKRTAVEALENQANPTQNLPAKKLRLVK